MHGKQTRKSAGELAFHFERGREYRRAVLFWQQAGEYALGQSAYQKALGYAGPGSTSFRSVRTPRNAGKWNLGYVSW
jgi:hypothetical protein